MSVIAIIPARYASTRLPGKILLDLCGKPMVQHVYERVCQCPLISDVLVATDDTRIHDAVTGFGGRAVMTRPDHQTGTDRLAEVAAGLTADVVVNVQGDEPLIHPASIELAVAPLLADPCLPMSTLCEPLSDPDEIANPNAVKVVRALNGDAIYFSRHPIPFDRDNTGVARWFRHIGLYAYRRDFLLSYAKLEPTPLSVSEALEQLRVLEHGYRIRVVETPHPAIGVDTPEDLERVRLLLAKQNG